MKGASDLKFSTIQRTAMTEENQGEFKMINWKVRIKNKAFWLSIIPAALLFIQVLVSIAGIELNLGELGNKLISVVNAAFGLFAIMGIVNDPTTDGLSDSSQAMAYTEPKKKEQM